MRTPANESDPILPGTLTVFGLVLALLLLTGCAKDLSELKSTSTVPVCSALIGPIKYNSQKPASPRFAGPQLAPDLKQRNQVGEKLHCPKYR